MGSNKRTTMVAPTLMAMAFLVKAETYASAVAVLASAADCYATPLGFRERSRVSAVIRGIRRGVYQKSYIYLGSGPIKSSCAVGLADC
jgi:hypothetical protein